MVFSSLPMKFVCDPYVVETLGWKVTYIEMVNFQLDIFLIYNCISTCLSFQD